MKSSLDKKRLSSESGKLSTMASKVYKPSTHLLILITLPVRLQQLAGKKSQTSQRIIMRKIGFAFALIVFTIFIQVRPRICNHFNYLFVYQRKHQSWIYKSWSFLTKLDFRFDLLKLWKKSGFVVSGLDVWSDEH